MTAKRIVSILGLTVLLCGSAVAEDPTAVVYDAESALAALKNLEGEWMGSSQGGGSASSVRYEVIAAGGTVVKTYAPGAPNEMLTVYHMDGDDLVLTHYCALDNQPRMRFVASDRPGEIRFEFDGGTNFDPNVDAHAHEGWTRIHDDGSVETESIGHAGGEPRPARRSTLRRR
ncbi:MAG: hypothetical protein VYE73_07820 [Acidobacteriota bacterium]|nr:hypothetical protein [Acidobacteriota bacterium]